MDAYQILVIILSTTLAIFLVLAIVLIALLIELSKKLNRFAKSAESVVDNVEQASSTIREYAAPAAFMQQIIKIIKK
jgi:hypothetical protein